MRQIEVQALISPVLALAAGAGRAIMAVYERAGAEALQVARKGDQSPLTEADLAAHRLLCAGLQEAAPGIPVVSEEDTQPAAPPPAGWFWLIDPLDGTKEFIARNGEFTVNIALIHDGYPVLGVVLAPALDVAFWGGLAHGAFRRRGAGDAERIRVAAPVASGAPHRVVASRAHLNPETESFIARLGAVDAVGDALFHVAGEHLILRRHADHTHRRPSTLDEREVDRELAVPGDEFLGAVERVDEPVRGPP